MFVDGEQSPDLAISEIEDYGSLDGMKVGPMSTGEVGPFSSVKLEIIWQPHIPGKVFTEFLISFSDPLSESVSWLLKMTFLYLLSPMRRYIIDLFLYLPKCVDALYLIQKNYFDINLFRIMNLFIDFSSSNKEKMDSIRFKSFL